MGLIMDWGTSSQHMQNKELRLVRFKMEPNHVVF